uniref:Uncharacterized protein n=1 Tax=Oryza sativa subsp. japonica TaxID=39947 RepID=Q2QRE3_ORYSJ|nr:hypothetical protein LOC_Os12g27860 [Oryza sativa Japonica Group]
MEVMKPIDSRRRQLALKMMTPISGDGDVASCEDNSSSWCHTRRPVGEDVDAQQRRHDRPAVQAETPVGGRRGGRSVKTLTPINGGIIAEVADVGTKSSINGNENISHRSSLSRLRMKVKTPMNSGIIGQLSRQKHQSATTKASQR